MAFGGTQANLAAGARTGQSRFSIHEVTGVTLAANAAASPDRANADTGALTTNQGAIDAVPANTNQLLAGWGPGADNWTQTDVDAVTALAQDTGANVTKLATSKALVANVNPAPSGSTISNENCEVLVHNLGAGAADAVEVRLILESTLVR